MSVDQAARQAALLHRSFGTDRARMHAGQVSAYLGALPARVQAKCERDGAEVCDLPDLIGVSWADIDSLAAGQLLGMYQVLLIQHWLGDIGRGDPLPEAAGRPPAPLAAGRDRAAIGAPRPPAQIPARSYGVAGDQTVELTAITAGPHHTDDPTDDLTDEHTDALAAGTRQP